MDSNRAPTLPPVPSTDPLVGRPFGKYELLERLAVGGMAEVYLATLSGEAGFRKTVVIKQVLPAFLEDQGFIARFLDEGRLAARLSHPNIAQTFELGAVGGQYYLAMEYVPGKPVSALLKRSVQLGAPIPLACSVRVLLQLLEALDYAHSLADEDGKPLRIVHRDVSPSNLMVTDHGGVKLLDFGIARTAQRQHETNVGHVMGKPGYMAPEQCVPGPLDHRVDLFGAGAVLYALTVQRAPFASPAGSDVGALIRDIVKGRFPRPSEVVAGFDAELEHIILRAMRTEPEQRFHSAAEMHAELEAFASAKGLSTGPRELTELVRQLFPALAPKAPPQPVTTRSLDVAAPLPAPQPPVSTQPHDVAPPAAKTLTDDESPRIEEHPTELSFEPPASPGLGPRALALRLALVVLPALLVLVAWRLFVPPRPAPRAPAPVAAVAGIAPPSPRVEPAPAAPSPAPPLEARPAPTEPAPKRPARRGPATAARTGFVHVNAEPYAVVLEGGRELGVTPVRLELPVGRHQLLLKSPDLDRKRVVTVTVKEDETTTVFESLER